MRKQAQRFILVGLDGFQLPMARRFAREGYLPNIARLMEHGVCGELISCLPAWTPTNWGTIATGAYPGSTGLAGWFRRAYDDLEGKSDYSTFSSKACEAETIWEAAERQGVRSLTIFHPISWPPRVKDSMVVAPFYAGPGLQELLIAHEAVWSAKQEEPAWKPMEAARDGKRHKGKISVGAGERGLAPADVEVWFDAEAGKAAIRHDDKTIAEASRGKWSEPVWLDFGPKGQGGLRFHLVRLDPSKGEFLLYQSPVYPRAGYAHPDRLNESIAESCGPFPVMSHLFQSQAQDLIDLSFDQNRDHGLWMAQVAHFLLDREGWQLYYQHYHLLDALSHNHLAGADPSHPAYEPQAGQKHLAMLRRGYQVVDDMLGEWIGLVDSETAIMLLSDHGNSPNFFAVNYDQRLAEAGLQTREDRKIVWEKTKAYMIPQRISDIYINLKGRSPRGVVDPKDYEKVQDEIIDALLDWRNPENGQRVVAFALKKQHAQLVGFYGEEAGDVVFVCNPHYGRGGPATGSVGPSRGANHGPQVATARTQLCSNLAGMILAGSGVRRGYVRDADREGLWNLVDVVPTIAWLMGFQPPRHSRGGVMFDALE